MSRSVEESRFDVFLSCCGSDRGQVKGLVRALRRIGVTVFLDDEIARFAGISNTIMAALASSKALVAYYTTDYAVRAACQFELMTAFLAGQQEGDALRRILVINPEPNNRHLAPAELDDALFSRPGNTDQDLEDLALEIEIRVSGISTSIGEPELPAWPSPRAAEAFGFVGRYRELWDLHSGLVSSEFPLTRPWRSPLPVAVCGLPVAGKSALVAAYVTRFRVVYPAGAWWISLADSASMAAAVDAYAAALERFGRLSSRVRPGLLIVDDVPASLDVGVMVRCLVPLGLRVVLISDENLFDARIPVIELGSLPREDAVTVLSRSRPPDSDDEESALSRVTDLLGCHAGALVAAANQLKDRQGILSYSQYATLMADVAPSVEAVVEPLRSLVGELDADERFVLQAALLTDALPMPARLLVRLGGRDPGAVLTRLRRRMIARRSGAIWMFEPIAVSAFSHFGKSVLPDRQMVELIHEAVVTLMADADTDVDEWCSLADIGSRLTHDKLEPGVSGEASAIPGHFQ